MGAGPRTLFGEDVFDMLTNFTACEEEFWGPALAARDSDLDGIPNGEELQDPTGAWTPGDPQPGDSELVTNPGVDEVPPVEGSGGQFPGDCNGDGAIDVSDPVCLLIYLFVAGGADVLPCGDGTVTHPANIELIDFNADGEVDVSDAVGQLSQLFVGGSAHELGTECVAIEGCVENCDAPPEPTWGWQVLPNSPLAPYYHHDDLFFITDDIGWLCNISGEIWKTTDRGDSWTRVLNRRGSSFRTITFVDEMKGWVGNLGRDGWVAGSDDPNVLYATVDGGITWTPVSNISGRTPDGICGLQAIGPDTIHGAGRYAGGGYFISSRDGGESWVSRDLNADFNSFVDVLFFTPDVGYITGSDNRDRAVLLYTTDGGESWETVKTNDCYHYWKVGFASESFGYGICWSGRHANRWIQTYDGGETWTDQIYTPGRRDCDANGIGFLDEQTGWIGCHQDETYETTDGGKSWHFIYIDPIYDDSINKFLTVGDVIYGIGNRIYKYSTEPVAAAARSAFDNSLSELSASPVSRDGNTAITYKVPEDGNVQITVYVRGGLIYDRPVDEHQQAGTYTIEVNTADTPRELQFNSRDRTSFYVSLVTGRYRQTIKLVDLP
jgi:photosystem II stability/assembly factor-like uncharacterized protein